MQKVKDLFNFFKGKKEEEEEEEEDDEEEEEENDEEEEEEIEEKPKKNSKKVKNKKSPKEKETKKSSQIITRKRKPKPKREELEEEIEEDDEKDKNKEKLPTITKKKLTKNNLIKSKKLKQKLKSKEKDDLDLDLSEDNSESSKDSEILMTKNSKNKKSKKTLNDFDNFENCIIEAYKKISDLDENKNNNEENDDEEKTIIYNSQMKLRLKYCEKKLREALNILEKNKNIVINRNIVDKLSRSIQHDNINLSYIIGNIYIKIMNKEFAFDYDDKYFDVNDLIFFINKVIQLKEIIKNTKIGIVYSNTLIKFLIKITKEFEFDKEQLSIIINILEKSKELQHTDLLQRDLDDLIFSISDEIMKQNNIYEQYKVIIQNKKLIIGMLKSANIDDKDLQDRYLELGKNLAYLFFNKSFRIYLNESDNTYNDNDDNDDSDNEENININNDLFGVTYLFYDGYKNRGEVNVINTESFLV